MVGIAMPPKADNPRLDPNFLGDRPGAAPIRRQQNYPRPLQIALQRHRRAATRLKHLAIVPRKVDFSCFGYHPYLESRLTIQEKWVLGKRPHNFRHRMLALALFAGFENFLRACCPQPLLPEPRPLCYDLAPAR
jgi:hypothetical protein